MSFYHTSRSLLNLILTGFIISNEKCFLCRLKRSISKVGSTTRNVFRVNTAKGLLTFPFWPLDLMTKFIAKFAAIRYHGLVVTLVPQTPLLFKEMRKGLTIVQDAEER